jgi:predicted nuclease of predicted toxin-antitoxin system
MNLSPRWVHYLDALELEAVHWSLVGAIDATDAEIMAYAEEHNFVVLTHDLDFGAILATTRGKKPSVIQIRSEDVSPDVLGDQVVTAIRQMEAELEAGALMSVEPARTRIRILPLQAG